MWTARAWRFPNWDFRTSSRRFPRCWAMRSKRTWHRTASWKNFWRWSFPAARSGASRPRSNSPGFPRGRRWGTSTSPSSQASRKAASKLWPRAPSSAITPPSSRAAPRVPGRLTWRSRSGLRRWRTASPWRSTGSRTSSARHEAGRRSRPPPASWQEVLEGLSADHRRGRVPADDAPRGESVLPTGQLPISEWEHLHHHEQGGAGLARGPRRGRGDGHRDPRPSSSPLSCPCHQRAFISAQGTRETAQVGEKHRVFNQGRVVKVRVP